MVGRRVICVFMIMCVVRKIFRNGVVAEPAGKRMAAREALGAEPDAAQDAEPFDGLIGVLRAGGLETAGAGEQNREIGFVATESKESEADAESLGGFGTQTELCATRRRDGRRSHPSALSNLSSSVVRMGKGAVATFGLG
jgi:hypothetical protein